MKYLQVFISYGLTLYNQFFLAEAPVVVVALKNTLPIAVSQDGKQLTRM